jgi:hypothetical protein
MSTYNRTYYSNNREKCLAYQAKWRKTRKDIIKEYIFAVKSQPCQDCGKCYNPWVMDFDHRDPAKKSFKIANMIVNVRDLSLIQEEVAKCDVVCSNCHRERTYKQGFLWKET